jgi:hypothetical protein
MDASAPLKQYAVSAAVFGVLCRIKHGMFAVARMDEHQNLRRRINDMIALLLSLNIIERVFVRTYRITNGGEDYIQSVAPPVYDLTEFDSLISTLVYSISGHGTEELSTLKPKRRRKSPYKSGDVIRCSMQTSVRLVMEYLANPHLHRSPIRSKNRCTYVVLAGLRVLGAVTMHDDKTTVVSQWFFLLNEIYTGSGPMNDISLCTSSDADSSPIPDFGTFDPTFSFELENV